jgi:hypothetical protein
MQQRGFGVGQGLAGFIVGPECGCWSNLVIKYSYGCCLVQKEEPKAQTTQINALSTFQPLPYLKTTNAEGVH